MVRAPMADRFRRIAAVADVGSNWRFRPRSCENAKVAEPERLPILEEGDFFGAAA